ncbi:type IV pilus modification PilV family protein [Piscinibacter terrae]|uniref:Uncharacterized protein n=1 Tax=Piscinibacter terrae TaxID=2496871 RepID=A0A3N7HVF7_9BURK|nr:hypothetical protein [Albitalea terrae]RQP24961.1 hypothetical protein DZC73_08845 [Albitalea terrae]
MRRQRGATLIQALLAFAVLSLGVLGTAKLQAQLRRLADIARQQSEAVRLAQEDMESTRAAASPASGSRSIAPGADRAGNTSFTLVRNVATGGGLRSTEVLVSWPDRGGTTQRVALQSIIDDTPVALSAALQMRRDAPTLRPANGRAISIPAFARNLGDGRSAFKPNEAGTIALVMDNTTGLVTARCDSVRSDITTRDLDVSRLGTCTSIRGLMLSGAVRFSLGTAPDARRPRDKSQPLDMQLVLTDPLRADRPLCITEQHERDVSYHCVVFTLPWSGRSEIVPIGWTLGTGSTDLKACRYTADQDGSGAVDSNLEHPDEYKHVDRALMQQNFLIVTGDQPCPAPARASGEFADFATVQHQP